MSKVPGLPYLGSKKRFAKQILAFADIPESAKVYDCFGGGGALTCASIMAGHETIYNELETRVHDAFKGILSGEYDIDGLCWSREEFDNIPWTTDNPYLYLGKIVNAFGNKINTSFLYGKDKDAKVEVAKKILADPKPVHYKKHPAFEENLHQLEQIQRLQQLEHLQQLRRVQGFSEIQFVNGCYQDLPIEAGAVYLCDPPYENALGYGFDFDYEAFRAWTKTVSDRGGKVIVCGNIIWENAKRFEKLNGARSNFGLSEYVWEV